MKCVLFVHMGLPAHLSLPSDCSEVRVARYLVFYVVFFRSFCPFSFGHCIVLFVKYQFIFFHSHRTKEHSIRWYDIQPKLALFWIDGARYGL